MKRIVLAIAFLTAPISGLSDTGSLVTAIESSFAIEMNGQPDTFW